MSVANGAKSSVFVSENHVSMVELANIHRHVTNSCKECPHLEGCEVRNCIDLILLIYYLNNAVEYYDILVTCVEGPDLFDEH